MRICHVMRTYPRDDAPGPGLSGYHLARCIEEPSLYITRRVPSPPIDVPSHVELREVWFPDPLPMPHSRAGAALVAPVKVGAYGTFLAGSLRHMLGWKPDVIVAQSMPALLHGALGARLLGVPWAFSFRGTELQRAIHPPMRQLVASANHLFYVSQAMEPVLSRYFPGTPRLYTPSGVDLRQFNNNGDNARNPQLLTIGRFTWQKGYDVLADALPEVFENAPELQLTMVATGPGKRAFEDRLEQLKIRHRVTIIERLGREEIAALLRQSAMMLLPSIAEGLPKVILEAMATGTPVVASDIGSCARVLGNAGAIVPPGDHSALAHAILATWRDQNARISMSRAGIERAKDYSWEHSAESVRTILEEMVTSKRTHQREAAKS